MAEWSVAIRNALDTRGGHTLRGAAKSIAHSARHRRLCLVRWSDGAWMYRYRDATIPSSPLFGAPPYDAFTREARDVFLYDYEPREGDVVFDVGAGVGAETLLFSKLVGDQGRVVSLEAHPGTYGWLTRLCEANALENVVALSLAASDEEAQVQVSDRVDHINNTILEVKDGGIPVRARRLDGIARDLGIEHVDLLKMNVEGAEIAALAGMGRLIESTHHVCIACHDFRADLGHGEMMRTKARVMEFLAHHGFSLRLRGSADAWIRDYVYGRRAGPSSPS